MSKQDKQIKEEPTLDESTLNTYLGLQDPTAISAYDNFKGTEYEERYLANPYANVPNTTLWEDTFGGWRSKYDEQLEKFNTYNANLLAEMQSTEYDSAQEQAERLTAAGQNVSLTGVDSAGATSGQTASTPGQFRDGSVNPFEIIGDIASTVMSGVKFAMDFKSGMLDLDMKEMQANGGLVTVGDEIAKRYAVGSGANSGVDGNSNLISRHVDSLGLNRRNTKRLMNYVNSKSPHSVNASVMKDRADYARNREDYGYISGQTGYSDDDSTFAEVVGFITDMENEAHKQEQGYKTDYFSEKSGVLDAQAENAEAMSRQQRATSEQAIGQEYNRMIRRLAKKAENGDKFAQGLLIFLYGGREAVNNGTIGGMLQKGFGALINPRRAARRAVTRKK